MYVHECMSKNKRDRQMQMKGIQKEINFIEKEQIKQRIVID